MTELETKQARLKYMQQKRDARNRKIPFEITFEDWLEVWTRSDHWNSRGKFPGGYVMGRIGDIGPYARHNVHIITSHENALERNVPTASCILCHRTIQFCQLIKHYNSKRCRKEKGLRRALVLN